MDARLNPYGILGLQEGDAHVIRNAGGVVTDDEIRSLAISQRLLGTEEIILIHHTDCGMLTFTDDEFKRQIQDETGIKPDWAAEAFTDLDEDVRQSIARIKASPFVPHKDKVRGFVYEVETRAPARGGRARRLDRHRSGDLRRLAHQPVQSLALGPRRAKGDGLPGRPSDRRGDLLDQPELRMVPHPPGASPCAAMLRPRPNRPLAFGA